MITTFRSVFLIALVCFLLLGCGHKEKYLIEIDSSRSDSWVYLLGADLRGMVATEDSQQTYSGTLRTYLEGLTGNKEDEVRFRMKDVKLVAGFLSEAEIFDMQNRLGALMVSLSPKRGVIIDDSLNIPRFPVGGWDVLRSVARVIPVLPGTEMAIGSSWEREQQFPLNLKQGRAMGTLFQVFKLDSVFQSPAGTSTVALSWVFTYRVSLLSGSKPLIRSLPLAGSGEGYATIDLERKELVKSRASFQIAHTEESHIELGETVHLEAVH